MVSRQQTVRLFFPSGVGWCVVGAWCKVRGWYRRGGGFFNFGDFTDVTQPPARVPYIPHRYSMQIGRSSPPAVDMFRNTDIFPVFHNFSPDFVLCECRKNHILRDWRRAGRSIGTCPAVMDAMPGRFRSVLELSADERQVCVGERQADAWKCPRVKDMCTPSKDV